MRIVVADTSVVVDGRIRELVEKGELKGCKIVIPSAVLSELEHQANLGKETGFSGLAEIMALGKLAEAGEIQLEKVGERPTPGEIKGARLGDIDANIRKIAQEFRATLITADKVQSEVAKAEGINVMYLETPIVERELSFKKYFTENTLSVHLKENTLPIAKLGVPGNIKLIRLSEEKMTRVVLREMAREIIEMAKRTGDAYIEIDRKGATVIQLGEFRIAITRPPFSDGLEITIIRPIFKASLEDYALSEKLKERLVEGAEGVVICGPPGAGKSTLAAALAEFYVKEKSAIVKTLESPRDLQVIDEITQYAPLEGSFEKTADILLLVRPDYSIYDEMRKTEDFKIFSDMRLAGIGMIGVLHANRAIDAVQRFIGRIDLGMIPQIIDTVIFVKDGRIRSVYELKFIVKVPTGMWEEDLARPVIEVRDFETQELAYEIYKFGEETVVLPIMKKFKKRRYH